MVNKVLCTKAVRRSGHSLCLYITKEAKELGLNEGEPVFMSLEVLEGGKNKDSKKGVGNHEIE